MSTLRRFLVTLLVASCGEFQPTNPYDRDVPVEQQALGKVKGQVRAPLASTDATALVLSTDGRAPRDAHPDETGAFTFDQLVPGTWHLSSSAPGYYTDTRDIDVGPGETIVLPAISLVEASGELLVAVTGNAKLANQRSSAGISVRVVDTATSTVTDDSGDFVLNLTPGTYKLRFSANGYEATTLDDVQVAQGRPVTLDPVTLRAQPASLSGHVCAEIRDDLRANGVTGGEGACAFGGRRYAPASDTNTGATVTLRGPNAPDGRSVNVDPDGAFTLGDLSPGTYDLQVEWPGYRRAGLQAITLAGGDARDLSTPLLLDLGRGSITGVVRLPSGVVDSGSTTLRVEGWDASAAADASGRFTITGLVDSALTGPYVVVASRPPRFGDLRLPAISVTTDQVATYPASYELALRTGAFDVEEGYYVRKCALTLRLTSTAAHTYRVSLDESFTGVPFAPFTPPDASHPDSYPFQLPGCDTLQDGVHTLWVQFADDAGEPSVPISADVFLDRRPPTGVGAEVAGALPATLDDGSEVVFSRSDSGLVAVSLVAIDPPSVDGDPTVSRPGSGVASVWIDSDPAFPHPQAASFGPSMAVALPAPGVDGEKDLYVRVFDRAGNAADLVDADGTRLPLRVLLDRTAPTDVALTLASLQAPPPPDAAWTSTVQTGLSAGASDEHPSLLQLRVSNDPGFRGAAWQAFTPWMPWSLTPGDGTKTVYLQVRDAAGNAAPAVTATLTLATVAPGSPTASITAPVPNRGRVGAAATTTNGFSLALSAVGAFQYAVSGDVNEASNWLPYATNWTGSLTPTDGAHAVRVQFRDRAGNVSQAATVTVELDRAAPVNGAPVLRPAPFAAARAATVEIAASGADEMMLSGDLSTVGGLPASVGAWIPFQPSIGVDLTTGDAVKTVRVDVRDFAGNSGTQRQVTTLLDTLPATGTLALVGSVADGASSQTLSGNAQVTARVTATDGTGSGVTHVRLGGSLAELGTAPWQAVAAQLPWTLSSGDGTKTVYLQLRDAAGNDSSATTPVQAQLTLDTTPPTTPVVTVTSPASMGPGNAVSTTALTLSIATTDAAGSLSTGRVQLQGDLSTGTSTGWLAPGAGGLTLSGSTFTWTGALSSGDGAKSVSVLVRDAAGNVSGSGTVRFNLQSSAPQVPTASVTPSPFTGGTAITLALSATGASQVKLAGDLASVGGLPANVGAFIPYAATVAAVLTTGDGTKNLTVTFKNDAGLTTTPITLTTKLDTTAATGTLVLAGVAADGAPSTALTGTTEVTARITAADGTGSGPSLVRLGGSLAELAAAPWQPFASQLPWSLATGDGTKTVFLQLRDAVGNDSSASTPIQGQITLDSTPPTTPVVTVTSPASMGTGNAVPTTAITLSIATTDAAGSLSTGRVQVQGDLSVGASTGWLAVGSGGLSLSGSTFTWTGALSSGDGAKSVSVLVRDAAGNVSGAGTVRFNLQSIAPQTPAASLAQTPYTGGTAVTFTLSATGASQVRLAGDLASVNGLPANVGAFVTYAPTATGVLTSGDALKTITVTFKNDAGLTTTPITLTTTLDTTAPTGTLSIVGPVDQGQTSSTRTGSAQVKLVITSSDASSGATDMRLADTSGGLASVAWTSVQSAAPWSLASGDGTKSVFLQLRDRVGNTSAAIQASTTLDLTPPSVPVLAAVAAATSATTLPLSLSTPSTDALSGPVRYEWVTPSATTWAAVTFPTSATLVRNAGNTFRVRAVDLAGNASVEASVSLKQDDQAPRAPAIVTPRAYVNATTTSVTFTGSEIDTNFLRYELCATTIGAGASCPATCSGYAETPSSFALSLTSGQRTCVFGRAVDLAGNSSTESSTSVVSDLSPPQPPAIAPVYNPSQLTIHADAVDVFIVSGSTDLPVGGSASAWKGVQYLEVDSGSGYSPLCPQYLTGDTWDPCRAVNPCTDTRLRCVGTRVDAVHVPLVPGLANRVALRSVDLAGNVGDGVSQVITTQDDVALVTGVGAQYSPRLWGTTLVWREFSASTSKIAELGLDRRLQATDPTCTLTASSTFSSASAAPDKAGVLYVDSNTTVKLRRRGTDGVLCTGDDPAAVSLRTIPANTGAGEVSLSGERAAWAEGDYSAGYPYTWRLYVREAGADNTLGTADDPTTIVATETGGNSIESIRLAGKAVLYSRGSSCTFGTNCWRVLSTAAANFSAGGLSSHQFPAITATLSGDGRSLLSGMTTDFPNGPVLTLRTAGTNAVFEASGDDVVSTRTYPAGATTQYGWTVALDGPHAVAIEPAVIGGSTGLITDWNAGGDGAFGTSDDSFQRTSPSTNNRGDATLSNGLLAYTFGDTDVDLLSRDLTTFRWESVGSIDQLAPVLSSTGVLVHSDDAWNVYVRTANGTKTSLGGSAFLNFYFHPLALDGSNLLVGTSNATLYRAGSDGLFFTSDDPAPATLYTGTNDLSAYASDGKALIVPIENNNTTAEPIVLEPGSGALVSATLVHVRGTCSTNRLSYFGGISKTHAMWDAASGLVCVKDAGADGKFGTADDPAAATLKRFPSSPLANYSVSNAAMYQSTIALFDRSSNTITLVDAGPDDRFNTADDVPTNVPMGGRALGDAAFSGRFVAYIAIPPEGGGPQVYLYDRQSGVTVQQSFHYSPKSSVGGYAITVDPNGRTVWTDGLFTNRALFTLVP